ncbi:hypothetical protein F0U61_02620 [Archangium violaceum]|uniref:hypothetical protein n=1 Tax=Archangium violaceum TaxID=83451 RepID=UPI002B2CE286|nr:hypothetical protein F0U61_02620 [Archangium violaceum]
MTRRLLLIGVSLLGSACGGAMDESMEESSTLGTVKQRLALFDYIASNTNYAQNVTNSAHSAITLAAGETVMIGTCGVTESAHTRDTFLRLLNPASTEVATADDSCDTLGSRIVYTAPSAGDYTLRAGCFSSGSCSGTVAIARRKATFAAPTLSNTNNATINTYNKQYYFTGGDTIRVSTCGSSAFGATASGDTVLRLFQQTSGTYTQVATNDTAADGSCDTAAEIVYAIPTSGYYQIRVGCTANTACSATVAIYTE